MKKVLFISCVAVATFTSAFSFAQMGGGMSGGHQGQTGGVKKGQMIEHKG